MENICTICIISVCVDIHKYQFLQSSLSNRIRSQFYPIFFFNSFTPHSIDVMYEWTLTVFLLGAYVQYFVNAKCLIFEIIFYNTKFRKPLIGEAVESLLVNMFVA